MVLKNESDKTLIKRRTYQIERTLGEDDDDEMSEYLVGAVPNELTINIATADKINIDLSFVALDNEQRDGLTGSHGSRSGREESYLRKRNRTDDIFFRTAAEYESDGKEYSDPIVEWTGVFHIRWT